MKLVVCFPGIGYHCDKPLLYYSRRLARADREVLVQYAYQKPGLRGNPAALRTALYALYAQAEPQLADLAWADYDEVVFLAKSIGTAVAAAYAQRHGIACKLVLYTPLEMTYDFAPKNALAFLGTADPWSDVPAVTAKAGKALYLYPGANHSLECDDVAKNLAVLQDVMAKTRQFLCPAAAVTAAEMKALEKAADAHGLLYPQMMENAGRAAYRELVRCRPAPGRLLVVAGKGNNGGDGFVMARLAAADGWRVQVLLAEGEPQTRDAAANYALLPALPVELVTDAAAVRQADVVVDALYGTGFHGSLRPAGAAACAVMQAQRQAGALVLAVDLPSGVHADTGEAAPGTVQADITVTFHAPKPAHARAAALCGQVIVADIGINAVL